MARSLLSALLLAIATIQVALATYYIPPCDPPHRPDYGGYTPYKNKYPVGSRIKFFCNDGYRRHGPSWSVCNYKKKSYWAYPPPDCKRKLLDFTRIVGSQAFVHTAIKCPKLSDIEYGSVRVTGFTPGSTAHYECKKGFKLVGEAWRKCQYNGYWSGKEPECRRKLPW